MNRAMVLAVCAVLNSAAASDSVTVTAAALERFDGEAIEIGYADPRAESGFAVLDSAIIENGAAILSFPLSEPLPVELMLHGAPLFFAYKDWREASEDEYDIPWLNVSDEMAFDSPFAALLRVNAIPASFLVNAEGRTVARNLHGRTLEEQLEALLGATADAGGVSGAGGS